MSSWTAAEWVGLYGAVLATALGFVQWSQWRKSQTILVVVNTTIHEFGRRDSKTMNIEITVTNRSSLELFVHACWAGYSLRRWRSPWRRDTMEAIGMNEIDEEGILTGKQAGYFDLPPGKRADFCVNRREFDEIPRPPLKLGFGARKCIAIDHSASAQSVLMFDV